MKDIRADCRHDTNFIMNPFQHSTGIKLIKFEDELIMPNFNVTSAYFRPSNVKVKHTGMTADFIGLILIYSRSSLDLLIIGPDSNEGPIKKEPVVSPS